MKKHKPFRHVRAWAIYCDEMFEGRGGLSKIEWRGKPRVYDACDRVVRVCIAPVKRPKRKAPR